MLSFLQFIWRIISLIFKTVGYVILAALFLSTLPYALYTTIYDFPAAMPFRGSHWYNPYQPQKGSALDTLGWRKANFHGHTREWKGLTDGKSSFEEFFRTYKQMGYYSVGISNYQTISAHFADDPGYIPCYEHGYNVWKRHHVCIGANRVIWLDFLFGQSLHHKQSMIDHLQGSTDIIAIAHPKFRGSFDAPDFSALTGYNCIEVLNHYRTSDIQWDSALSAGRPAWIAADDDTHNVREKGETGVCWTMIYAPQQNPDRKDLLQAMACGKAIGVQGSGGRQDILPLSVEIIGDTILHIVMQDTAASIELIGQGAQQKAIYKNISTINYRVQSSDTYIRPIIRSKNCVLWLNPILRTADGRAPTAPQAKPNMPSTIFYRSMWFMGYGIVIVVFYILRKRRRQKRATALA
jgi:hypothetical protein